MHQLGLRAEADTRALEAPAPLHVHRLEPVHHHLVDRRIRQQRLERTEPGGEQQHPVAQRLALHLRQRTRLALHQLVHLRVEAGRARLARARPLDQPCAQRDREVIESLHGRRRRKRERLSPWTSRS